MVELVYYVLLVIFSLTLLANILGILCPNLNAYKILKQGKPTSSDNTVRCFGIFGLLLMIYLLVWLYSVLF